MLPIHRVNERNKVSRVHDLRFRSLSRSEYRISLQKGSCAHLSYWTITLVFGRRFTVIFFGRNRARLSSVSWLPARSLVCLRVHVDTTRGRYSFPFPEYTTFFSPHHHFNVHEITHRTAFAPKISSPRRAPPS